MSEIKPALTPEEWGDGTGNWVKRSDAEYEWNTADAGFAILGPECAQQIEHPADRHALAALCLHGQPFGFTWADVDDLRWAGRAVDSPERAHQMLRQRLESLADRIAALLPPQEPK